MDDTEARDQLIRNLARLIAGLAVPVSAQMPLGPVPAAWTEVHRQLVGFGWATAEDYERELRRILDGERSSS